MPTSARVPAHHFRGWMALLAGAGLLTFTVTVLIREGGSGDEWIGIVLELTLIGYGIAVLREASMLRSLTLRAKANAPAFLVSLLCAGAGVVLIARRAKFVLFGGGLVIPGAVVGVLLVAVAPVVLAATFRRR